MSVSASGKRYAFGILLLLGVVFLWVGSSFLIDNIFAKQKFDKPFFLTYFNTGTFSLFLLIRFSQRLLMKWTSNAEKNGKSSSLVVAPEKAFDKLNVEEAFGTNAEVTSAPA
ncbi:hypothetical protein DSO57_1014478 [Entomophthora muscae]|uniref:Uncharacterized protein n=1 Tax=Entomophthora muscae TaxID=34485 RepID=A0ACC2TSC6_9FUNG|nr:hypothetical protein DSO57_1014478 [Entomophthora muscae]